MLALDGFVEVCQREEPGVTQRRHNPALATCTPASTFALSLGL